jgi:hypothetical protein
MLVIYLAYTWYMPIKISYTRYMARTICLVYTNGKKYISGIYLVYTIHKPFIWRPKVYTWQTPTQNFLGHFGTCHVTVWTWYIPSKYLVYSRYMQGGKGARCHTRSWDTWSVQLLRNETVQTCNRIQVDSRRTDRHNQVDQVNWLQGRRRGFPTGMEHRAIAAKLSMLYQKQICNILELYMSYTKFRNIVN